MNEIILLKCGEIALKGLNRSSFEEKLVSNVRRRLDGLGGFAVRKAQSTLTVEPLSPDADTDEAFRRLGKVYGIAAMSRACAAEKDIADMEAKAAEYLAEDLSAAASFKVEAKRSDKKFPLTSPQICAELGGYLAERFPNLRVDVHHPEFTVFAEVRERAAYIHSRQVPGAGGIPVGSGGKAALLLSGGIDSPVAGCMMAKRGLELCCVHFASPPYTSDRARQKVLDLAAKMKPYTGRMKLFVVPFTEIQTYIADRCQEEYFTLLMRRSMMRIAEIIAVREGCDGLVTGESVGQVASQTLQAIGCTDPVTALPILRPCAGLDKEEIVSRARALDTFELSILPYEDCCTVFTPKHPKTRPHLRLVEEEERRIALPDGAEEKAAQDAELVEIV